jgi:hypothetical protein
MVVWLAACFEAQSRKYLIFFYIDEQAAAVE